jgi:putative hemolysin
MQVMIARDEPEILGAQRLRYEVFVEELGGDGALVDHENRLERDRFDPYFDHLVLVDGRRDRAALDHVVGVYRLLPGDRLGDAGQFYSEDEYDLSLLKSSGRRLLELGRSCVHRDYRGGTAMFHLWTGLAEYVDSHGSEILFGVASFHGTDVAALAEPLSLLHHRHLAPEALRVRAQPEVYQSMDLMPEDRIDRAAAMKSVPALIKAYLRLGGSVGDGAYIDHDFKTTDVCLIMDTARLSDRTRAIYRKGRA